MKKIIFSHLSCLLILITFNGYSQILIDSNGNVGINQSAPAYNLDWYGDGRFWSGWGQLIFDCSSPNGTVTLHPNEDWVGTLGTTEKKFNNIYTYVLHYEDLNDWSDERLKENIMPLENSLEKINC